MPRFRRRIRIISAATWITTEWGRALPSCCPCSNRVRSCSWATGMRVRETGEVTGGAIETSLDVDFSVDLIKKKRINWPRLENSDFIMVLGSSRAINEAMQHATTELMRWLMADYGFDERGASLLLGQAMEFEISNVVDPEFTIVAKMRKRFLGQR